MTPTCVCSLPYERCCGSKNDPYYFEPVYPKKRTYDEYTQNYWYIYKNNKTQIYDPQVEIELLKERIKKLEDGV